MPEQAQKLLHFTDNVLKTATEESEALARELEAKRQAALAEARQTSRDDAHAYYERESAKIRAEAGQEVSRHLMDGKRQVYLRRSEISREVLDKVRGKLDEFVASPQYPEHLKGLLAQTVSRLDGVHEMVIQLRHEDLPLGQELADSVAPVKATVEEGRFQIGGLVALCPELGIRADCSFDAQLEELGGHFAEIFGLSLSDDLDET